MEIHNVDQHTIRLLCTLRLFDFCNLLNSSRQVQKHYPALRYVLHIRIEYTRHCFHYLVHTYTLDVFSHSEHNKGVQACRVNKNPFVPHSTFSCLANINFSSQMAADFKKSIRLREKYE